MKCEIHGDKILVTPAIKNYITEKIGRLDRYFEHVASLTARVIVKVKGHHQSIEVTIPTSNFTIRNEQVNDDLYKAIDLVIDKLERQIVKNKTKIQDRMLKSKNIDFNLEDIKGEDEESKIVRRKKLETKPMNEEEAILEMNMLGHDFFIYKEAETNNVNVLYRRKDGDYGIIEIK